MTLFGHRGNIGTLVNSREVTLRETAVKCCGKERKE